MRAVIEATLVLTLSLVVTLLILAAIFARHPLGAIDTVLDDPDISPAVFVRGEHDRPGKSGDQRRTDTGAAESAEACPYLAALAAATECPAAPESSPSDACPYLREVLGYDPDMNGEPVEVPGKEI